MNIKLSKRMKQIADMVTPGRVTADIGCDHGLVSVYLALNGIAPKVYAMDVAEGPLESAAKNINEYGLNDKVELRLSNGFDALESGETECAVIAGMGGQLMITILESGLHKFVDCPGYELILSPQSDIPLVRKYLREHGIVITDEELLLEDGKYYNVIKAEIMGDEAMTDISLTNCTVNSNNIDTAICDNFGYHLIRKKSPILKEYLQNELEKKETLFCRLSKTETENTIERLVGLKQEVDIISKTLNILN